MEIGWTDVGSGGYILVSTVSTCAHSNTSLSGTAKVKIVKNERDPPLFTGKLLIKFQNILRNTTQVIIQHRNFIRSLPVKRGGSLSFFTIFNFVVPELLDFI
jgi:hypothetical protein